jgi:branched-subunit amino acid transport protein
MNTGEGNGKPLLNNTPCLENPSQDHQESNQTQRTTSTTTTTTIWGLEGQTTIRCTRTTSEETETKSHCIAAHFRTHVSDLLVLGLFLLSLYWTQTATIIYCDPSLQYPYLQPTFPISAPQMEKIYSSTMVTTILQNRYTLHPPRLLVFMFHKFHNFPHLSFPGYLTSLPVAPLTKFIPDHVLCMPPQHTPKLTYILSAKS